jgi:hypothetical protein
MTIAFAARADLDLATLDLAAADQIVDVSGLRRRDDCVPPGVVFDFWTTVTDGSGNIRTKIVRQPAGTPGDPGTIYASFNLGPCDTVPSGAATACYNALNAAQWEGTIQLMEQDCSGSVHQGNRLRITNGATDWAAMDAIVQQVTELLDHGLTTITLGPPDGMGAADFLDQLNRLRNRPAPTAFCLTQHNGTEGVEDGVDDAGNPTSPPGGDGEGDQQGVDGPATGNAPGAGTPTPNPAAGTPAAAAAGSGGLNGPFSSQALTLCDGSHINVLTRA